MSLRSALGSMTIAAVAALQRRLAAVTGGVAGDIVPGSGAQGNAGGNTGSSSSSSNNNINNNNNNIHHHHTKQHSNSSSRGTGHTGSAAVTHACQAAIMGVVSESEGREGGARRTHARAHSPIQHAHKQTYPQAGMSGSRGSSSVLPSSLSPAAPAMVGLRCGMAGVASPQGDLLSFPSRGSQSPLRGRGEASAGGGVGGAAGKQGSTGGSQSAVQGGGGVGASSGRRPRGSPAVRSLLATVDLTAAQVNANMQQMYSQQMHQQHHQGLQSRQPSGSAAGRGAASAASGASRPPASPRSPACRPRVALSPRSSPNTPRDFGSASGGSTARSSGPASGSGLLHGRSGTRRGGGAVPQPPLLSLPEAVATGGRGRSIKEAASPRCVLFGTPSVAQTLSSRAAAQAAAGRAGGHPGSVMLGGVRGGSSAASPAGANAVTSMVAASSSSNRSQRTDRRKVVPVLTMAPVTAGEGYPSGGGQSSTEALKQQQQRIAFSARSGPLMQRAVMEAAGLASAVNGGGGGSLIVKSSSRLSFRQKSGKGGMLESGAQQQQQQHQQEGEAAEGKQVGGKGVVAAFEERMARLEACRSLLLASAGKAGIIQQQQQQVTNTDGKAWKSLIGGQKV